MSTAIAIGIDVGTTGCKVAAIDESGEILGSAQASYPLLSEVPGSAELDPDAVWSAVVKAVRRVVTALPSPSVSAVGLSTAGEALIPLDRNGDPLARIITSVDTRNVSIYKGVLASSGAERFRRVSELEPRPHYSIFRWAWFAAAHPDVYRRSETLGGHAEWLSARLGATILATDPSLATRTLAYRPAESVWDSDLLLDLGLDPHKLPRVKPSGTRVGRISSRAAQELGLNGNPLIVVAGLDQACAAFALGLPAAGTAMLSLGTTAVIGVELDLRRDRFEREAHARVPVTPHLRSGSMLALAGTPAGCQLLWWFDTCVSDFSSEEGQMLESLVNHRTDLIALPHLGGSRAAFDDPDATGAIIGLRFATNRNDIRRALIDGVAYELGVIRERLLHEDIAVDRFRAVGGGSRSNAWLQTISDSTELPIETTSTQFAAAIGAAEVALNGPDHIWTQSVIATVATVEPRPEWREYHASRFERYRGLYSLLAGEREDASARAAMLS